MNPFEVPRRILVAAICSALSVPTVNAQQLVADRAFVPAPGGEYATLLPGEHVFHALNGGVILARFPVQLRASGNGAHGAHASGEGSVDLYGGSVAVSGSNAAGLSASNALVQASGVRILATGRSARGVLLDAGRSRLHEVHIDSRGDGISMTDSTLWMTGGGIQLAGSGGYGLYARGGQADVNGSYIQLQGDTHNGLYAAGDAAMTLRSSRISGTGYGMTGVTVQAAATMTLDDVDIVFEGGSSTGIATAGRTEVQNARIALAGLHSRAVEMDGGELSIQQSQMAADTGIRMMGAGVLGVSGSEVHARYHALDLNLGASEATVTDSLLSTSDGTAIFMPSASSLQINASQVHARGDQGLALDMRAGTAEIRRSLLRSEGSNAHGAYADGGGRRRPVLTLAHSDVWTQGEGSAGAIARQGGTVHLQDSVVLTEGSRAYGVLSGGAGEMTLANTHVRTKGQGAWAAVINDSGRLSIDGGSLVSDRHGGIWLRSSRDPALALNGGVVVSGGNGIGLALDAAVAGRFDVALQGASQLHGDIVITPEDEDAGLVPRSEVHVRLAEGSLWQGSSTLMQTMMMEGGSQWTLTGDATVGALDVRGSGVALSGGGSRFNRLTVDGDLHSEGATFLFQGALGGDDSAFDRLYVRGDTSGDASIAVKNIGGIGAQTTDGIPLIEVDGASLATYTLAGRAVGGSHEYFLFKGGVADPTDGNWYLRSQWFDVCQDDPHAPGCVVDPGPGPGPGPDPGDGGEDGGIGDPVLPPPVLRPEPGAYLANQSAALNMFAHRMHDRGPVASPDDGRHAWARVGRSTADFSAVGDQLAVDGSTSLLQIGSDVWRTGNAALGVMLGSGRADSSVVSRVTGYSAKGRVRGTAVGVYGTWLQNPGAQEGAYVDATAQYGRFANRVQGVGLEREYYDARVANASLESGYTVGVWQGRGGNLYVQPQLQLSYAAYAADRHVESNGTRIERADAGGLSGRAGVRVFGHRDGIAGRLQPYAGVNWLRGSGRSTLQFNGERLAADVPRNRYELQAGAELMLDARWSAWGGISAQRGDHGYRNMGGQVGMRMAW